MKKSLFFTIVIFGVLILLYGEWRSIYCIGNNRCVTVWKTFGDVCYIIPGKYYGLMRPANTCLKSTNDNNITLYFSADLPNTIIYQSDQEVFVENENRAELLFRNYYEDEGKTKTLLYLPNATRQKDVKPNVDFISLGILDNYARGKDGRISD